ncbi:MAG: hypothetical protein AMJ88_05235 [Anaerolineae bacterium SM23_ 63]|nr:MAG: hypothetical protein AMJ88_05235 [Anaerolineae bacterium SM23_ 63]
MRNPYDEAIEFAKSQGYFAPGSAQNDIKRGVSSALSLAYRRVVDGSLIEVGATGQSHLRFSQPLRLVLESSSSAAGHRQSRWTPNDLQENGLRYPIMIMTAGAILVLPLHLVSGRSLQKVILRQVHDDCLV